MAGIDKSESRIAPGWPTADDEPGLIMGCKKGNAAAYETLYRRHAPAALRVATLITGDRALAEDCLQEAAIRAWSAIGKFDAGRPFHPWFLRITVNEALKSRRSKLQRSTQTPMALAAAATADAVGALANGDAVTRALATLDSVHRATVVLFYYVDLSERGTAELLGVRVSTVKSRLHTARARLADALRQEGFGDEG